MSKKIKKEELIWVSFRKRVNYHWIDLGKSFPATTKGKKEVHAYCCKLKKSKTAKLLDVYDPHKT